MSAPMDSPAGTPARNRRFALPKVFGYDFFISFKLGSPPAGAQSYASDLARRLRELDYTVFYSEEEAAPGEALDSTLVGALHRSRILVVIVTSGALRSPWVRKEVEEFRRRWPSRPILLINVDKAIQAGELQADAAAWLGHEGRIWLDETAAAVDSGIVTSAVVERLRLTPQFLRANLLLRGAIATIVVALLGLTTFAWTKSDESQQRLVEYNLSQGRSALGGGRPLDGAVSLLRALREGEDTDDVRFMLARALASPDMLVAYFDASALSFAPDGASFAVAGKAGGVEIRRTADLSVTSTLPLPSAVATALVFSPDGTSLAVHSAPAALAGGNDCRRGVPGGRQVTLWETRTHKQVQSYEPPMYGHDCQDAFFIDEDGVLGFASWTTQRTDLYWSASTFDSSGALLRATAADERDCRWEQTLPDQGREGLNLGCPGQVVGVSADGGTVVVAPWDLQQRQVVLWSTTQDTTRSLSFGRDAGVRAASFSADGGRVAVTLNDAVEVWSLDPATRLSNVPLAAGAFDARFSPDGGRIIAARGARDAVLLDAATGELLAELTGHVTTIRSAAFSSDGSRVVTGGDDAIAKLWDAWTGRALATLEGHRGPVSEVGFSPDDRLIVTRDRSGRVYLWDNRSSVIPRTLREDPARVRWWSDSHFALDGSAPDGQQVLLRNVDIWSGGGATFSLWDTELGLLRAVWRAAESPISWPSLPGKKSAVSSPCSPAGGDEGEPLAQHPSGHTISLEPTDAQVALVRSSRDCQGVRLTGHGSPITGAAISPGGDRAITADSSGELRVWNPETGELLYLARAEPAVGELAFLTDDRAIILNHHNTAVVLNTSLERRTVEDVAERLACSGLVQASAIADLISEPENCPVRLMAPAEAPLLAAEALTAAGWARARGRAAQARLEEALRLFEQSNDRFGTARAALALRAMALRNGDAARADALARQLNDLIASLAKAEDQRARVMGLGELAFNEFADIATAQIAFTQVLKQFPEAPPPRLALWETSLGRHPDANGVGGDSSSSMRAYVLGWVATVLANRPPDDAAYGLWNMYTGTTIDPIFERMDFRGLRRQVASSPIPVASRRKIDDVLRELEHPGNRSERLKQLLRLPEDAQTIGP